MGTKLGQNFLNNKGIVKKIIKSANLTADDVVLEIGPGKGILTEELSKVCKKIIAVEIDRDLVKHLKDKFQGNKKIEIINEDILNLHFQFTNSKIQIKSKIQNNKYEIAKNKYKVIANIPYYITSPIIRFFLENKFHPEEMILMVQKEVAERIVAGPGNHSILSISVQYYADPEILFYVDKKNFDPMPAVDSAIIRITHHVKYMKPEESKNFFRMVRAGFSAKRKTLINNLSNSFHLEKREVEEKLRTAGISPTVRAQELSIYEWKKIVGMF